MGKTKKIEKLEARVRELEAENLMLHDKIPESNWCSHCGNFAGKIQNKGLGEQVKWPHES